jgi:hypothetical protein
MSKNINNKTIKGYAEGGVVNADLDAIYKSTLGRSIGSDGLAHYQAQMDSGMSLPDILTDVQNSEEAQRYRATQAAQTEQATQASQAATNTAAAALMDPSSLIEKATTVSAPVSPDQLVAAPTPVATQETAPAQTATFTGAGASAVDLEELEKAKAAEFIPAKTVEADLTEAKANAIIDGTEAATAEVDVKSTVRGQLAMLMDDFEGGEATPVWASGAMRKAMQVMQSRGMGASSIAGTAVVQAAMESAMAVAVPDAQIYAAFQQQNLSNEQQTTIFKSQQRMASLFSDQAAVNASAQFNASSENQTNQFFANMEAEVSKFNSAQVNAILQFNAAQKTQVSISNSQTASSLSQSNAAQVNAQAKFNTEMRAQTDQFNSQNSLIVSQSNAVWRQQVATADTAAQNMANLEYTKNVNAVTGQALDQIWQRERDLMDFAFTASESSMDRANSIMMAKLSDTALTDALKLQEKMAGDRATSAFLGNIATSLLGI